MARIQMAGLIGAVWGWKEGRMQNEHHFVTASFVQFSGGTQILNFKGKFGRVRYIIPPD